MIKILPIIVSDMSTGKNIVAIVLAVFLAAISIAGAGTIDKPQKPGSAEENVLKFEQPGLAILSNPVKTASQPVISTDQFYQRFTFPVKCYKKFRLTKERELICPFLRNVFYEFVSIHAP